MKRMLKLKRGFGIIMMLSFLALTFCPLAAMADEKVTTTTTTVDSEPATTTEKEVVVKKEEHSIVGGVFHFIGEVIAFPFRLIGGVFDAIF